MIGSHPYSNLICISSWYICIPNIIWIHLTITEKMIGNCHYHECVSQICDNRLEIIPCCWSNFEMRQRV
jgi:hypothetical protein